MKKFFLICAAAFAVTTATPACGGEFWDRLPERLLFYIPNRLIDAFDLFSVNIGAGPIVEARLMCTRAVDVGAGWGMAAKMYKGYNRQYGFGVEEGWYWSFISVGEESQDKIACTALVDSQPVYRTGFPEYNPRTYDFITGSRDYWQIGGALGCLIDGQLYVHPLEWIDFALGFFLIDIKNDDLSLENFQ